MDKVMIVGGYEFLSFHLSTRFLELGMIVHSIGFENRYDIFQEEKRLSLGRNSNLIEIPIAEWIQSGLSCESDTLVILSLFDLFLKKDEEGMLSQLEVAISELELTNEFIPAEVVFLLPLQNSEAGVRDTVVQIGEKLVNLLKEKDIPYHVISLPTLYGPWQPIEFAFQQVLYNDLKNRENLQLSPQEWIYDAIFIDDAVNEIVDFINTGNLQSCTLKNKTDGQWIKCAEKLGINSNFYEDTIRKDATNTNHLYREIEGKVNFEQGLIIQQQHLLRVLSSV
ncbi:hypothetical protein [Bacillus marasmi]|uniref:hypothetical protein n=1 Tax=Bacillus marasmi TaxID=1926279 RepID=UPI0011C8447C|nr:hypothetical protein [Bacillus marasmi]